MEVDESHRLNRNRVVYFTIMVTFLVLMSASLGTMFHLSSKAAQQAAAGEAAQKAATQRGTATNVSVSFDAAKPKTLETNVKFLARLAWVSAALMAVTLLVLFWVVIHFILGRAKQVSHHRTQYVDAWRLAGQRVKPIDDDEIGGEDDEGEK